MLATPVCDYRAYLQHFKCDANSMLANTEEAVRALAEQQDLCAFQPGVPVKTCTVSVHAATPGGAGWVELAGAA